MSQQHTTNDSYPISIFYEVVSSDTQDADPAELQAVADTMVEALEKEGYVVHSRSVGTRGFEFLYQIVPFIQASAQVAITHKDDISSAIDTVKPELAHILAWRKQRLASKAEAQQGTIEFEVKFGAEEDVFRYSGSGADRTEHLHMVLDHFDQFLAHSQHARTQAQPRVVEQDPPTLTIREHIPPRPRRTRP